MSLYSYKSWNEQAWNMSGNDFDEADASMDGQLNYFAKESTTSVKMTN